MIKAEKLTKKFGEKEALGEVSCIIPEGSIYGLVGSNGAGKSTLLRILSGIYKADSGTVNVDGQEIWENPVAKGRIALVTDDPYFPAGITLNRMVQVSMALNPYFDKERYEYLTNLLGLSTRVAVSTFSKGMKRQAAIAMALCRKPSYLLLDEAFDGLDPVMRRLVRSIIAQEIMDRGMTTVITSHSLRELEGTCDTLALLHKGDMVLESDVGTLKTTLFKLQVAFRDEYDEQRFEGFDILHFKKSGSVAQVIAKGDADKAVRTLRSMDPILLDVLPLTLEEVFDYEMEALGYSFHADGLGFLEKDSKEKPEMGEQR